jgi:hypothetical protein
VARVMAREFPGIAPVEEVKVFKALVKHTQPKMMEPAGRWKVPPLFALPVKQRPELAHCRLEAGRWVIVKRGSQSKPGVSPPKPSAVNPLPTRRLARAEDGEVPMAGATGRRLASPGVRTEVVPAPPGVRVRPPPTPRTGGGAPLRPPLPQRSVPLPPPASQSEGKGKEES